MNNINNSHQQHDLMGYIKDHSNPEIINNNKNNEDWLVENYSLLGTKNTSSPLAISTEQQATFTQHLQDNVNLFAHVLLDNFSSGTGYTGMSQASHSIGYMESLADTYYQKQRLVQQNPPTTKNLVDQLRNARVWDEKLHSIDEKIKNSPQEAATERNVAAQEITVKIKQLQSGESFWLSIGYFKSGSGHSMYCQFHKKSDSTYDIYIYDANGFRDLTGFTGNTVSFGSKNKRNAFIVYEDYPAETLFLAADDQDPKSTRIAALMEIDNPNGDRQFGRDEVVAAFQGVTTNNKPISYKSGDQFVTPQRSGSCTWNSLKELVEHEFVMQAIKKANGDISKDTKDNGKAEYREFKTFVKLATIVSYYDLYEKEAEIEKKEAMRNQLILAAKDILKSTEGNKLNNAHQDQAKLRTIKWTAYDLLERLTKDHADFEKKSYTVTEVKCEVDKQSERFHIENKPQKYNMVKAVNFEGVGKSNIKKFDMRRDAGEYCEEQSKLLDEMYKKLKGRSISDDLAIIQSATNFLDSLPLANDEYWRKTQISPQGMEKISKGLSLALSVYNQVVHSVIGYNGQHQIQQFYNTAAATYLLLFKLMKDQYPAEYENYGLHLQMFVDILETL